MDERYLARIGFSRLRLPVPLAKLTAAHAGARALESSEFGGVAWEEYLSWIGDLELESEVVEALSICLLARASSHISVGKLQRVITRPSALSDHLLTHISGAPLLVKSWGKAHSGEIPSLYTVDESVMALTGPKTVPPILAHRFEDLERETGLPFSSQWAFEIERLIARFGYPEDGYLGYWTEGVEKATGHFIPRSSHFARSAYLRTLALAFDLWDMPIRRVNHEASFAGLFDLLYLPMLPGLPPAWVESLVQASPTDSRSCDSIVEKLCTACQTENAGRVVMYLNAPLSRSDVYQADLRITTCFVDAGTVAPEEVFELHDFLLDGGVSIQVTSQSSELTVPPLGLESIPGSSARLLPGVVPGPSRAVGFMSDLMQRFPYLPANHSRNLTYYGRSRVGGIDLQLDDACLGTFSYWNQQWRPFRYIDMGPPCGVALAVDEETLRAINPGSTWRLYRFWEANVFTRENSYGEWKKELLYGVSPVA